MWLCHHSLLSAHTESVAAGQCGPGHGQASLLVHPVTCSPGGETFAGSSIQRGRLLGCLSVGVSAFVLQRIMSHLLCWASEDEISSLVFTFPLWCEESSWLPSETSLLVPVIRELGVAASLVFLAHLDEVSLFDAVPWECGCCCIDTSCGSERTGEHG